MIFKYIQNVCKRDQQFFLFFFLLLRLSYSENHQKKKEIPVSLTCQGTFCFFSCDTLRHCFFVFFYIFTQNKKWICILSTLLYCCISNGIFQWHVFRCIQLEYLCLERNILRSLIFCFSYFWYSQPEKEYEIWNILEYFNK